MKEIINKLKKTNQSKRIVILFITISFAFIAGFSLYNEISGNYQKENKTQITQIEEKNTKNEQENQEDTVAQQENNTFEESTTINDNSSKKETKNGSTKNKNQSTFSTVETNKKTEESNQSTKNTTDSTNTIQNQTDNKIKVSVQVIGVDSTMMTGTISIDKEATAYSVLKQLASQKGVSIEINGFGSTIYVKKIGDIAEFDKGNKSGWLYRVNGVRPNCGANSYVLSDGDNVKWYYTIDYTKD